MLEGVGDVYMYPCELGQVYVDCKGWPGCSAPAAFDSVKLHIRQRAAAAVQCTSYCTGVCLVQPSQPSELRAVGEGPGVSAFTLPAAMLTKIQRATPA